MKTIGAICEYSTERDNDLMNVYHEYISGCNQIRLDKVWEYIAQCPARRFYVSEERAATVVSQIMQGQSIANMRKGKQEMFMEIHRKVVELMSTNPKLSVLNACVEVVNSPAPKFYMTPRSIRVIIYKAKKKWYSKRKKY